MTHHDFVHKCVPMFPGMKIPDARAARSVQVKEEVRDNSSLTVELEQQQEGNYSRNKRKQNESPFCFIE